MNQKITVERNDGKLAYCIVSSGEPMNQQLNQVFDFTGEGFFASFDGKNIRIVHSSDWQEWGCLPVISIEDCNEDVSLKWTPVVPADGIF